MRLSKLKEGGGLFVLAFLLAYSIYRIGGVFYAFPIWPATIILLLAGGIAFSVILVSLARFDWAKGTPTSIFLLMVLVCSLLFSVTLQYFFLDELIDNRGVSSRDFPRLVLAGGVIWMACGCAVQAIKKESSFYFSSALLVFLMISVFSNLSDGLIISYAALSEDRSDGLELNHLVLGESAAFLLILSFSFAPQKWRTPFFLIGIFILFSLGGRTALFTYFLAIGIYLFLKGKLLGFLPRFLPWVLAIAALGLVFFSNSFNDEKIARMLLLDGVGADDSVIAREYYFEEGLRGLSSQIVMGDAGFMIRQFGGIGTYIHNLLSAWQFYGVLPFIIFSVSLLWVGAFIWKNRRTFSSPIDDFGVIFFIYAGISILAGKSIVYFSFWFVLGFWLFRMGARSKKVS